MVWKPDSDCGFEFDAAVGIMTVVVVAAAGGQIEALLCQFRYEGFWDMGFVYSSILMGYIRLIWAQQGFEREERAR